jgi:hypothetical protein
MSDNTCPNHAVLRYTWPGRDESWICIEHAPQLAGVARAMGLHLQMIPLDAEEQAANRCTQYIGSRAVSGT